MSKSLNDRPHLGHLKKQAKDLLRAFQKQNQEAYQCIREHHPRFSGVEEVNLRTEKLLLADAQLVIAREYGFESWSKLKEEVLTTQLDATEKVNVMIEAALSGNRHRVDELLAKEPELAHQHVYIASVLGEVDAVRKIIAENPQLVKSKGGPCDWEPLLYVCFSRLQQSEEIRAQHMAETAKILLEKGADPNAFYLYGEEPWPDTRETALYGAVGVNNNPLLGRVLLEAGAKPNDGESLYHASEHTDNACLRLLFEYDADPNETNALKRKLDFDDLEGVRLFLEKGADPNQRNSNVSSREGDTALHHAIVRGRGVACIELLLEYGADMHARNHQGITPYGLALRMGKEDIAKLLQAKGADVSLSEKDRFIGACYRAAEKEAREILSQNPQLVESLTKEDEIVLVDAAKENRAEAVNMMLKAGFDVSAKGESKETALHQAAWFGCLEVVEIILPYHPDLEDHSNLFQGTVLGWAVHGSANCPSPQGDYTKVVEALVRAGAKIHEVFLSMGTPEITEVLKRQRKQ